MSFYADVGSGIPENDFSCVKLAADNGDTDFSEPHALNAACGRRTKCEQLIGELSTLAGDPRARRIQRDSQA